MSTRFLIAIATLFAASAFAQNATTITRTSDYTFPIVGLGSTETLGVNLLNAAANTSTGTASSCTGSIAFFNAAGTAIGAATTFTLAANAATSITLPFSSAGITGTRGLIRTVLATTTTSSTPCALSSSLNTFDTGTGATHVFIAGSSTPTGVLFANPGH